MKPLTYAPEAPTVEDMKHPVREIEKRGWRCACLRCGYLWTSLGSKPPSKCSRCKSRYWNRPRVRKQYRPAPAIAS